MSADDVPADFPHDSLGAVPGAQPKVLVQKNERGEYISEEDSQRAERWAICADLCVQLVDYVNKHWDREVPREDFVERVVRALDSKRTRWGIWPAEAEWIAARLRATVWATGGVDGTDRTWQRTSASPAPAAARMTLDELIAAATQLRTQVGGDAPVYMMTARGYASVLMTDSLGFADEGGNEPAPMVLLTPDARG